MKNKKFRKREEQHLYGHALGVKVINGNVEAGSSKMEEINQRKWCH